jgi:hypothetical protein
LFLFLRFDTLFLAYLNFEKNGVALSLCMCVCVQVVNQSTCFHETRYEYPFSGGFPIFLGLDFQFCIPDVRHSLIPNMGF